MELREANWEDVEKEFEYVTNTPENENGFTNSYSNISLEKFKDYALPRMLNHAKGIDLPEGFVPCTEYFLWDNDEIVGWFRLRQKLSESLRNGAGHIGYGIKSEYRKKGYATEGLKIMISIAKDIIDEDEIYMSVRKDNAASLQVQLKNGAYIHHEDDVEYYTRIGM
ncbi:MAG: GNAT family N-acetyltransferase [Roseburia sp.]|nr:GNAT family N-acetyltransferase [Roseburia sp.]